MKTDKLIRFILIGFVVVLGVNLIQTYFFHKKHPPIAATRPIHGAAALPRGRNAAHKGAKVAGAIPQHTFILGSDKKGAPYRLAVAVDNVSAGIRWIKLNAAYYRQHAGKPQPLLLMRAEPNAPLPFSTRSVRVAGNGTSRQPARSAWGEISYTPTSLTLGWQIADKTGHPLVTIYKTFQINKSNYDMRVTYAMKNMTGHRLTVRINQFGPITLPRHDVMEDDRDFGGARYDAQSHYLGSSGVPIIWQASVQASDFTPHYLGMFFGAKPLVWVSVGNRFFTVIVRPLGWPHAPMQPLASGGQIPKISFLRDALVERIDREPLLSNPRAPGAILLRGRGIILAPHGSATMPLDVYAGPKKREILQGSLSAPPATPAYKFAIYRYISVIQFNQGPCAFCTFSWLSLIILKTLDFIHRFIPNYGIAIIVLVILVRLALHPLTRYGQVSMATMQRKMATIQPEIERMKQRLAKDKAQQQTEMMRIYRENNVNPASGVLGCLPMVLQMPIWIALYAGLAVDIDLRHAAFIPGWINDLANPDTVARAQIPFHIPMIGYTLHGHNYLPFNVLPLLLTVVFFLQMRYQMKLAPTPTDPQQAQTQKISQFMIFLFPIFLYNRPSGLNLYIFASTAGGLLDTYLVRRHLKKRDLLPDKSSPAPVAAKPGRAKFVRSEPSTGKNR